MNTAATAGTCIVREDTLRPAGQFLAGQGEYQVFVVENVSKIENVSKNLHLWISGSLNPRKQATVPKKKCKEGFTLCPVVVCHK